MSGTISQRQKESLINNSEHHTLCVPVAIISLFRRSQEHRIIRVCLESISFVSHTRQCDKLTLTCFFKSCGLLKLFPQNSHLCGFSGTCTRMCEVMWSRLTVVVRHVFQPHVRLRLFVLFRPTWFSQMWS